MRGGLLRDTALASLFFLLATVVFTWPIAAHVTDGLGDIWDAKLNAWILHWDFHQTFRDPLHLYDANIFYPARYSLAFSENLFGAALFAFPLYAAGVSTLAAYNVVFLLGMFLSAMAAWALTRDVTGDPVASAVAGLVYAFCPWRIAHIPHIQFQWGAFLALALLFLLRYFDKGRRRDVVLFAVCFAWNALCNVHYALFSGLLIALVLLYEGLVEGWRAFRPRFFGALAAMTVAAFAVLPLFVPYALASKLYGMQRGTEEIGVFSGVWTDFLTAGGQNKLYAPLTRKWAKAEGELFPGITALALAVVALARRRGALETARAEPPSPRRRGLARVFDVLLLAALAVWVASIAGVQAIGPLKVREPGRIVVPLTVLALIRLAIAFLRRSRFADLGDFLRRTRIGARRALFLAIAVASVVIALGTHTPYYRFLVQSFGPIFHAIRAPVRGVVLFDLGLAVLAAWGLADLTRLRRPAARLAAVAAAVAAIGFEYRAFPVDISPVERTAAPVYHWLGTVSLPGAVIEWPFATDSEVEYQFRSTAHWKPLVNGYSGFGPPQYQELAAMFAEKPIRAEVWKRVVEMGACLLIVHPRAIPDESRGWYAGLLRAGIDRRRIEPITTFANLGAPDLVFRLTDCPLFDPRIPASEKEAAARRTLEEVSEFEHNLHPPFGVLDVPRENDTVSSGAWSYGWALDDSGIAEVRVSFDEGPNVTTAIHQLHPGVREAHPDYPESTAPGFGFAVPALPPGRHTVKVILVGRDGGKTDLSRKIVVR
jgi:hypothetical protein